MGLNNFQSDDLEKIFENNEKYSEIAQNEGRKEYGNELMSNMMAVFGCFGAIGGTYAGVKLGERIH